MSASSDSPPEAHFRSLPSVQRLRLAVRAQTGGAFPPALEKEAVRAVLEAARQGLRAGGAPESLEVLCRRGVERLAGAARPRLRRVLNATGVILHTNLGRAPLSQEALERIMDVARGYSNLELDLSNGERGSRQDAVAALICRLTGAEAALVVNNNAAAILLALSALARGTEVIVSRGELVEIGGAFRVPDILEQSGARLREVGTTNRTRLTDYERAISPETGALLKVHPSNFRVVGFTEAVDVAALAGLARTRGIPLLEDLGSGSLVDLAPWGLHGEPTVAARLAAGVDLVTLSGDKLLGGPQAGILVGRADCIRRCRIHPLARALRIDKLCLAALEATLSCYAQERERADVPVLAMLTAPLTTLETRARRLAEALQAAFPQLELAIEADVSPVGGGAFPEQGLPTRVLCLRPAGSVEGILARLRELDPPLIARVRGGALLLDPRSLRDDELGEVVEGMVQVLRDS